MALLRSMRKMETPPCLADAGPAEKLLNKTKDIKYHF